MGGYVLTATLNGSSIPCFYTGQIYTDKGDEKPSMSFIVERAKRYKTRHEAIDGQNTVVERTGVLLEISEAADFAGRI